MSPTLFAPMLAVCSLYLSFIFILFFSSFLSSFPFIPPSCLPYPSLFSLLPNFSSFSCICGGACMWVCRYVCHVHTWGGQREYCVSSLHFFIISMRQAFSLNWKHTILARVTSVSVLLLQWQVHVTMPDFFTWVMGIQTQVFIFAQWVFAHWTASLGPHQVFYLFIFLIVFYHLKKLVMSSFQPRNPWLWILTGYQAYDFPLHVLVCVYLKKK